MARNLIFDVETHSSDNLFSMEPHEFVRLIGYKWMGNKKVHITTDLDELYEKIDEADRIIGHNIHDFDMRAIYGPESNTPLSLTMENRVFDTWTYATLVNPAPVFYTNRFGKGAKADSPAQMRTWFGLDEQAFQLGVPGKTDKLADLAFEFGDPDLAKKDRVIDGYGKIPVDDQRYIDYLIGDVNASEAVCQELIVLGNKMDMGPNREYVKREQNIAARAAVISSNGLRTNTRKAKRRVNQLAKKRDEIMSWLVQEYDFPTSGKSPWATNAGKESILAALADKGITPDNTPSWTRTKTGAPSLGGDTLIELTEGTESEELGRALAELKGQRSLAQLALDSTYEDGFVHPEITMLQRSGRWSTTKPGLTVWTSRGDGAVEKEYFVPDDPYSVLVAFDYSNADARVVAAYSGDKKYAERFLPGADGHVINAVAAWGEDVVATDPKGYRQRAKVPGHGWGYRVGANTLSRQTGMPLPEARKFLKAMNDNFTGVVRWQNRVTKSAQAKGYVLNEWGRRMPVEPGREYTQAPALLGQNGTREIMCDGLLAMPVYLLRRVKIQVHDELVFSFPRDSWEKYRDAVIECMETTFGPKTAGQKIHFPVSSGEPGDNWHEATH